MAYGFVGTVPDHFAGQPVFEECGMVGGIGTNNEAEYHALIEGLKHAARCGFRHVEVVMDSQLVCFQMTGQYRCKMDTLKPLHRRAKSWAKHFDTITFKHVKRTKNRRADKLANMAINLFCYQTDNDHTTGEDRSHGR